MVGPRDEFAKQTAVQQIHLGADLEEPATRIEESLVYTGYGVNSTEKAGVSSPRAGGIMGR